jgi:nucleotide-binding universal stress UspA family protein
MTPGRIVCAVDATPLAPHVVSLAAALARAKGASLLLLHVTDRRDPEPGAATRMELLAEAPRRAGLPVAIVLEEGEPAPVVLGRAEGALLVVMGTHGGHGIERMVLGSVAERVLDHSPCPVVTVREGPGAGLTRVVCGADLVDPAPLAAAVELSRELGAELVVLHAVPEAPEEGRRAFVPAAYGPSLLAEARARLEAAIAALGDTGVSIRGSVLPGRPDRQLVRFAASEAAGLVVVGIHPHLFGGTTHRVVREAACPVLTVRGALASEESFR